MSSFSVDFRGIEEAIVCEVAVANSDLGVGRRGWWLGHWGDGRLARRPSFQFSP